MKYKAPVEWLEDKLKHTPKPIFNSEIDELFDRAKDMEKGRYMRLGYNLERIDEGLSWLEDFCHGRVGEKVSEMRKLIQTELELYGRESEK